MSKDYGELPEKNFIADDENWRGKGDFSLSFFREQSIID